MAKTGATMGGMSPARKPLSGKTYLERVALRLRALREAADLSAEELAVALTKAGYQIKEPTIYAWEQARTSPHVEALPALAKVYRIKLDDVLPKR